MYGGVHRLHGCVSQQRQFKACLDNASASGQGTRRIAAFGSHRSSMGGVTVKGGENGTRTALALLRFIPLDIELPPPLQRGPRVFGEDSHSSSCEGITAFGRDGKHCPHARY